ncbi:MAG TPA: tRNA (cytidine(56)-2'-O)-methyltransferase [archaeon]|jgi:tRNA (cytidine56-2'-O)-methyltransferase|nr:tRNA (cytidine(56)-2'-O)-methyltransferase [archaeon]
MSKNIYKTNVLKLNHRPERDKRITTHCALVGRAFLADSFYFSGVNDKKLIMTIKNISKNWGGKYNIKYISKPIEFIKKEKKKNTIIIHLTMYGEKIIDKIDELKKIKKKKNFLIIIGGPKVQKEYYELADYNISVTNQPHSEVASLAILLYLLNPESLINEKFNNAKIKIIPCKCGKKVIPF